MKTIKNITKELWKIYYQTPTREQKIIIVKTIIELNNTIEFKLTI